MKPLTTALLAASLVANALLAYAAFTGSARVSDPTAAEAAAAQAAANLSHPKAPNPVDPATWSKLETADLPALVSRLREAGFPKDVIRAIMTGLLTEQFAARRRALDPDTANRAFWKDRSPDLKLQLASLALSREQQQALRALLGPDARAADPVTLARERARFGELAPEKLAAATAIEEDFQQKQAERYFRTGTNNMEDMKNLLRDQRAALAALLSPAELMDYDLRNSLTGQTLRNDLVAFNPTEEEYRAIFKLRQPFDEQFSFYSGILGQDQMRRRIEAEKQMTDQIKALLGPERGAAYERTTDYSYRQTAQLVARLELPPETANTLWTTQKEFEKRRGEIYATGPTPSPEARNQQLAALQQEAIAKITPILGSANRVETYKQYGGTWLDHLVPRPTPGR